MSHNPTWENTTVTGQVVERDESWDGPVLRHLLTISYEVDGAAYTHREQVRAAHDPSAPSGPSPFHNEAYLPIMELAPGDPVTLCYNPANPAQCYIQGNELPEDERAKSSIHTRTHRRWYVFLAILFLALFARWLLSVL